MCFVKSFIFIDCNVTKMVTDSRLIRVQLRVRPRAIAITAIENVSNEFFQFSSFFFPSWIETYHYLSRGCVHFVYRLEL